MRVLLFPRVAVHTAAILLSLGGQGAYVQAEAHPRHPPEAVALGHVQPTPLDHLLDSAFQETGLLPGIIQDSAGQARAEEVRATQAREAQMADTDRDGVPDEVDVCPATSRGAEVDPSGCARQSALGWIGVAGGAAVLFVVAVAGVQWWARRSDARPELEEAEEEWVVLPFSSEAGEAGIKPAASRPDPQAPTSRPEMRDPYGGQPGYGQPYPQVGQGYPPPAPGYPPQPWPAQPGYYPQSYPPQAYPPQPYPAPPQGTPPAYPVQPPPAQPPAGPPAPAPPIPPAEERIAPERGPPARSVPPLQGPGPDVSSGNGAPSAPAAEAEADLVPEGETIDEGYVRFHRPPDGTLQLLPGRLDVVGGDPGRGVIRFVRIPTEEPEVTFGRASGPQYRHIQLKIATVSRMHARMRFLDGGWWIENLSTTNPVVVNGEPLSSGDGSRHHLGDGDRIEMGEVVFRYWV